MEQDKLSNDPQENLRIENELLKIKLKAQFGDAFQMGSSEDLLPEMENQFLKNILAFEESYNSGEYTTVYERIGKPAYKPADELDEAAMKAATDELLTLMGQHQISLDFCDGPYDSATVYRFITEEFFGHEIEKEPAGGMITGFIYEEFHPNHKAEIEKSTHDFLHQFFSSSFTSDSFVLSNEVITAEGKQMNRQELLKKLRLFFDAFENFSDDGYNIDNINFELQPEDERGIGFAEGVLKYDALMDNKEVLHFEGPYKLYMQLQFDVWSVFYFVLPGFKW